MRFIGKSSLFVTFITTFLAVLVLISIQFQLLDADFWINTFRASDVYSKLESELNTGVKDSLVKSGATKGESEAISSILTKETTQLFFEKNAVNTLDFINNKRPDLVVYIPTSKLPKDIRAELGMKTDELPLESVLQTFGSAPFATDIFYQLKGFRGYVVWSLIISIFILLTTLIFIYVLESPGRRLFWIGSVFIVSGTFGLLFVLFSKIWMGSVVASLNGSKDTAQIILLILVPPIVSAIQNLWMIVSVATVFAGLPFLFLRKRQVQIPPKMGYNPRQ